MNPPVIDPLEEILRQCGTTAPKPWYPKLYAQQASVPRDSLDLPLERLRLGGLIQLTEWVEGLGQGYILTPVGRRALQNPRELDRLNGKQVAAPDDARPKSPRPHEGDATTFEQGETIRGALFASSTPFVTYALVAANILWYVYAMRLAEEQGIAPRIFVTSNTPQNILLKTGGLFGPYLVSGDKSQWMRLLWCCFVHANLLHLGMNMLGLFWVGPMVERMWGHFRFLAIYLIAGLGGSCTMVINHPDILGVGASGAIWGMMTSLAAWIILNRKSLPRDLVSSALRQLLFLFVLNLAFGFVPGISMAAHLGGGALGAIAAVFLNLHRFGRGAWRWLALSGVIALPLLSLGAVAYAMTIDPRWADLAADEERKHFNADLSAGGKADEAAERAYVTHAQPLKDQHPKRRDPADVEKALAALTEARAKLAEAIGLYAKTGPYRSARVETARQARLESLEAWDKLLEMTEQYLRNQEKDDDPLNAQVQRVRESETRLREALHGD